MLSAPLQVCQAQAPQAFAKCARADRVALGCEPLFCKKGEDIGFPWSIPIWRMVLVLPVRTPPAVSHSNDNHKHIEQTHERDPEVSSPG